MLRKKQMYGLKDLKSGDTQKALNFLIYVVYKMRLARMCNHKVLTEPVVIWGAGAMGGTVGAYFVRAGQNVLFVDIVPEHVQAINDKGIRITGPIDEFIARARAILPGQINQKFSTVLLCVKA